MTPDQQRLLAITASHIKLLTELETILRGESDALSRRQLQDLQAATERKQELLNRLEAAGHELFQLCQEAERLIVADAPWFFWNYNKAALVHQPNVHGIIGNPLEMDWIRMDKVWIQPRR